ncbi:unnamed protein product [Polarella glacialis]|uniref:AMP-dependent synthetase/ligase domain-containing protein n=1 Tax=Polarella glacialis TaxID=89957 RepID=A0A813HAJ6_POLGL|nr:unnamed protein product [Polarella glacialis]
MATRKYAKGVLGEDEEGWQEKVLRFWIWDADAYVKLLEHYSPKDGAMPAQLNCPIAVFRAKEDHELYRRARDDRDWMQFTSSGPFEYEETPTSHEMFLERFIMQAETDPVMKAKLVRLCQPDPEDQDGSSSGTICPWQHLQRLSPHSLSLIDENETHLLGQELLETASSLATSMRAQGLETGSRVLLVAVVGRDCLLAQLALVHCGASAVLIGPGESPEYLAQVAEIGGCSHALSLLPELQVSSISSRLCELTLKNPPKNIAPALPTFVQRASPATILFSSGSTGKPKGVVQSFGTLLALSADMAPSSEPLLWKGSIGWIANYALPYALAGQPLLVVPRELQLDPTGLKALRTPHQVRTLTLAPSELRGLLETPDCLSDLESVTCMAEALPPAVSKDFFAQYSQVRLMETYASSEVQGSNAFLSTEVSQDGVAGRFNMRQGQTVILVDPQNITRKVDVRNQAGELLLRPTANGYLDGKQTSMRFIPNPFGPGQLFRTGDLCKWIEVGKKLQLVGRVDFQVKVSGKLVELEHVEQVAEALPGVKQAAARTFVRSSGTMVVALFVSVDGNRRRGPDGERELKEQLTLGLPSHAVPAMVAFIDEIPLLKNGKKDRKALPEPDEDGEDEMTDSIGIVRAVGQRWAQEFRARQAICGISVWALVFEHWCKKNPQGHLLQTLWFTEEAPLFQSAMGVLDLMASRLSMSLLMWTVGYFDSRLQKTRREFLVQCGCVFFVYVFMAWPSMTSRSFNWPCDSTHPRGLVVNRWSCLAYIMYRCFQRSCSALGVPALLQALVCYLLAPFFLMVPVTMPGFSHLPDWLGDILDPPHFTADVYFRDGGHYLMGYWLGSIATQEAVKKVLGRSRMQALIAGFVWACTFLFRTYLTAYFDASQPGFVIHQSRLYFSDYLYPVRLLCDGILAMSLVILIGEGIPILRLMGQSLVGAYILHMPFNPHLIAFIQWGQPAGCVCQLAFACMVPAAFVLTIGHLGQSGVVMAARHLQAWK